MNRVLFLFLFIVSCAPNVNFVTPAGQTVPFPSYNLFSTSMDLSCTFNYAKMYGTKDLDGSTQLTPKYLDLFKKHDIFLNDPQIKKLILNIEIFNPTKTTYYLQENVVYILRDGKKIDTFGNMAISKLEYRKFEYQLPITHKYKKIQHTITLYDKDRNIIFIFGPFEYNLIF